MKIVIYGAGGNGVQFNKAISKTDIEIEYFIDQFSDKTEHDGKPIYKLNNVPHKDTPVYVSVSCYSTRIAEELRGLGFSRVYDFNDSVKAFPGIIEQYLTWMPWFDPKLEVMVNDIEINKLKALLTDQRSHDVLENIISFRKHLTPETYLKNDGKLQYFPGDIPLFDQMDALRFVDCGAFTGDTLDVIWSHFHDKSLKVDSVTLFEPDKNNLEALVKNVHSKAIDDTQLLVYPCGVWSKNEILRFSSNNSSSAILDACSNVSEDSVEMIHAVAIDDVIYGTKPNFIKMDIEGAEREALLGARKTIQDFKPILAICLYHKPADLWELPLLINELYDGYDFYLRVHGDVGLETVIYCVPKAI